MADIKIEDLNPDAGLRRLTGDTGVFIGGDTNDLEAAAVRYQAQQAYSAGRATPEQTRLLQDLDQVLQGASRLTPVQTAPPPAQRQYPTTPPGIDPVQRSWWDQPLGSPSTPSAGLDILKRLRGN